MRIVTLIFKRFVQLSMVIVVAGLVVGVMALAGVIPYTKGGQLALLLILGPPAMVIGILLFTFAFRVGYTAVEVPLRAMEPVPSLEAVSANLSAQWGRPVTMEEAYIAQQQIVRERNEAAAASAAFAALWMWIHRGR